MLEKTLDSGLTPASSVQDLGKTLNARLENNKCCGIL